MSRRLLAIGALALTIFLASLVGLAANASAANRIYGRITCAADTDGQIKGMWVSTNAGGNGWANWWGNTYSYFNWIASYTYNIPTRATVISVAVGCGGTYSHWAHTYYGNIRVSPGNFAVRHDWICTSPATWVHTCI